MFDEQSLKQSLRQTRIWFKNSGIMVPDNGLWGVAERVLLTHKNVTLNKTLESFPAWTPHLDQNYYVIEQRRADCCAQSAWLFLQLHEVFGQKEDYDIAHNILSFMFFRSGLLSRVGEKELIGTWNWSHIRRANTIWLDDNSWVAVIILNIARRYPELEAEYELNKWGHLLADRIAEILPQKMQKQASGTKTFVWSGDATQPHWGALACLALAVAARSFPSNIYSSVVGNYFRYVMDNIEKFTVSEYAYALIGATASAVTWPNETLYQECANCLAEHLIDLRDPDTGNLPSTHLEAPQGKNLGDTIYTLNWSVLGLQSMSQLFPHYQEAFEKLLKLLLQMQDTTPAPHLYGCWRGMYDFETQTWGGGDCYEGGASSIYSGWTNAPIAWAVAWALRRQSLATI